jgi:hypothetical protein
VRYIKEHEVASRMDALGLTATLLRDAVEEGVAQVLSCTANDPEQLPGILGWGKITRALRDRVVGHPLNWQRANHRGQPSTVRPDGSVAIIVASGTEETGNEAGADPATRSTKGPATQDAIARNLLTFSSIAPDFKKYDPPPPPPSAEQTWVLLYFIDEDASEVRLEVSLPEYMDSDNHVSRWRARIILAPIPLDQPPLPSETEEEEEDGRYEAPVSRAERDA